MIGLVLALIVVGIALALLGMWVFSIPVVIVALALFAYFVLGWGRRGATHRPDSPV